MKSTGPFGATFAWCPSTAQSAQQRFVLRFLADDHDNAPVCPKVCKDYTVLIRTDLPAVCAGAAPVITHTPPGPQTTADPIVIKATITDDKGLKAGMPWLYFTNTKPATPAKLNFSALSQLSMVSVGGNNFEAKIPNPTTGAPAGESRTVYYVIVAEDDDDPTGNCDHRTQLPAADVFQATVTKPATAVPCTKTAECDPGQMCGGTSCVKDTCTPADTNGDQIFWEQSGCPASHYCPAKGPGVSPSHCVESCGSDTDCKRTGYKCKVFDTKKGCSLAGSKGVGDACADFTECAGKAMCLQWNSGYCTISDCDSYGGFSGPCPSGSACVPLADPRFSVKKHWVCLKTCQGDGDCRQGYTCKSVMDDQDTTRKACL
jgi:hypothetical protein